MTRYLISFPDGAMDHIPDEEMPDVAKAAHAVVQEALNAGVYLFAGGLEFQTAERRGHRRDGHRRPVPADQGAEWRLHRRRRAHTGGCPRVGRKDRGRLPLCARGTGVRARPRTRRDAPPGQIGDGDVPATSDRRRPAALEQDLPWRRSDDAGLRIDLNWGRARQ